MKTQALQTQIPVQTQLEQIKPAKIRTKPVASVSEREVAEVGRVRTRGD